MVILLLILAGCCGFTPDSYRDHREEGPVRGLFTGPVSRVKKYASEELLQWFEENGRPTFDEWVATLLGDRTAAEVARKGGEVSRDR